MLWPAPLELAGDGRGVTYTHYGFVDISGKLVVSQRYESYQYCTNRDGRASFVIASLSGQKDDIYDLTGKLLRPSPTTDTLCGGVDRVIIRHVIDGESGKVDEGLFNVVTGKIEVPIRRNRHLTVVSPAIVNVSDPSGEYFDDLLNNARIPHPGFLDEQASIGQDLALIVTDRRRDLTSKSVKVGVIDTMGKWLLKPSLEEAYGFDGGFSIIRVGEKYTFLDTAMKQTGGTWDEIDSVFSDSTRSVVGYEVSGDAGRGLLGVDVTVIVQPGTADIDCEADTGVCAVTEAGATSMVALPGAAKTPLPRGFSVALSPSFYADRLPGAGNFSQRIFVVGTGQVVTLAADSACEARTNTWLQCEPGAGMAPPVVLDASGTVTPFSSVMAVADPIPEVGASYYWATSGGIEGFIDSKGTWRYQQSRYTQLED